MSKFKFNAGEETRNTDSGSAKQKIDFDALNQYLVDTVGTQKKAKAKIGVITGVIDLGLQIQEDAKMEWKGTEEDKVKELEKNPDQYFQTLPNDKGVPTEYKRWKVKPQRAAAITVDFLDTKVDKGQFFGEEPNPLPLRMLLNGEFYMKGIGKVVGKPYVLKEQRNDDGSWSFKNNTQLFKLADATDSLDEQGNFKANMLGDLIGKSAMFDVQIFINESGGKKFLNEKIKFSGRIPEVMESMVPECPDDLLYMVQFKGKQNPEFNKVLRQSVINTMAQALDFKGSDLEASLIELGKYKRPEGEAVAEQQEQRQPVRTQQASPNAPTQAPKPDVDDFDDDIPF